LLLAPLPNTNKPTDKISQLVGLNYFSIFKIFTNTLLNRIPANNK